MISAYSTRKKVTIKTPESKTQLFSMFQLNCSDYNHCESFSPVHNKQINSGKSFRKITLFPISSENNTDKKTSKVNQSQIQHNICNAIKQSQILQDQILPCEINLEVPRNTNEILDVASFSLFPNSDLPKAKQKNSIETYYTEKKSYRNHIHDTCRCVPYRKCQSFMEEKIVNIINKIKTKRQCCKQIETLIYKCRQAPLKELRNPYFVSGITTIQNIIKKEFDRDDKQQILKKINGVVEEIKQRVYEELDCIRYFEVDTKQRKINKPIFDQGVLIRKAYKISKKKKAGSKERRRQQAIQITQKFLASQPTTLALFWGQLCKL